MGGRSEPQARIACPHPGRAASVTAARRRPRGPCYVYGVVPSTAQVPAGLCGLDGEARGVTLVGYHRIAAAVSRLPRDRPLGTPADLRAHGAVLDALARSAAVLPMRFGGVLADEDAVVTELLEPHHVAFAERLDRLSGHAQFTIKGRYLADVALREVLAESPECMRLRMRLRGREVDACRGEGIRLGELVVQALESKQTADTSILTGTLAPYATAMAQHPKGSPDTAVDVAFLVARARQRAFEDAAEELGKCWQHRIRLRLVGPLAPYDFAQPLGRGE